MTDRFINGGDLRDPVTGVHVAVRWDRKDECWRIYTSGPGTMLTATGEVIAQGNDVGRNSDRVVIRAREIFDELVATTYRRQKKGEVERPGESLESHQE